MTTATILSSYLPQFENFVIEKNKKAEKLFCKQIGYDVSAPFIKRVDGEDYEYVTINIVEETISLDGWSVKGRVDDVDGDIIVAGFSDMTKYRNVSMTRCDHCNVQRSRNHLVVLAKDGEEKVVGSACLRDFVGHTSALQYLTSIGWALNLQETLEEEGMTRGTKQHAILEIDHLLNVAAALVRMNGYVSKAKANETDEEATKDVAASICFNRNVNFGHDLVEEKDKQTVQSALSWYSETTHEDTDFHHNLKTFLKKGYVPIRFVGYVVALLPLYARSKEKESIIPSSFIGNVGDKKVKLTLVLKNSFYLGQYTYGAAPTTMYIFKCGNDIVQYRTTMEFEEGIEYVVEATIKDHTVYKGINQTVITRARILSSETM